METIELNIGGRVFVFRVDFVDDNDSGAPWENADGHGPVTGWETRDKLPGELVLNSDRGAAMDDCQVSTIGQWEGPKAVQQCEAARQIYRDTMRAPTPFNRLFCEAK